MKHVYTWMDLDLILLYCVHYKVTFWDITAWVYVTVPWDIYGSSFKSIIFNSLRPTDAYICVGNLTIIASDNGLSPGRRQAIIWTKAEILLVWPLGTNFSGILIEIQTFWFKEMHLNLSSAKRRLFRLGLNVLSTFYRMIAWALAMILHSGECYYPSQCWPDLCRHHLTTMSSRQRDTTHAHIHIQQWTSTGQACGGHYWILVPYL